MNSRAVRIAALICLISLFATPLGVQANSAEAPSGSFLYSRPGPGVVLGETAAQAADPAVYLIELQAPPLAAYRGGIAGLAATNPAAKGQVKLDADSAASLAYRSYLAAQQDQLISAMETLVGHPVQVLFRYEAAYNGLAARLTPQEATAVSALPGVAQVQREYARTLQTDVGPTWIGAPGLWNGTNTGGLPGTKGEGIVIGVIDSGVNYDHPSFADIGGDSYNHTNPRAPLFYGLCAPLTGLPFCNDKLIGVYDFTGTTPLDDNGHGSHTASTTAGNVLTATLIAPTTTLTRSISGVAPHANLITYKACTTSPALETCLASALVAAINQAALDEVDVVNFSIGGGPSNPWTDADSVAFLNLRAAGVFASVSAGNDGPGAGTVGSPAVSPWVMSVAASTHNRNFVNSLVNLAGGSTTPPADILGKGVSSGYGPETIVYAGAAPYNNALCEPFAAGTFSGEIVICDRGVNGRVEKGQNVLNAGGGGMVLANDEPSGDSLIGDVHVLPAVHITYNDGLALKAWVASGTGHTGALAGVSADLSAANGDVMASFSSRGPNASAPGVLKPDVTAPGVDVFAAWMTAPPDLPGAEADPEFNIISGTSMSSPHSAGAAALIRALHPSWTPAEVQSALMTTAFTTLAGGGGGSAVHGVLKEDNATPADPFDMGAGRIDLTRASKAGLLLNETEPDYTNANPLLGGDPSALNLPSMADDDCDPTCAWSRTVTSAAASSVNWTVTTAAPSGMTLTVSPTQFTLAGLAGASQTLQITADPSGVTEDGRWYFAQVTLTPNNGAIPPAHLPVAVYVAAAGPDNRTVLHFHGNTEEGCTGDGLADLTACNGPFLLLNSTLSTSPAASWNVPSPLLDDAQAHSTLDPNWRWTLASPTTIAGEMTVEWWASCPGCTEVLGGADWDISLWADGAKVYTTTVTTTPDLPSVPKKLKATVDLGAEFSANTEFVLQIDPVYIDIQNGTKIYYDGEDPCPGTTSTEPCDSLVRVQILPHLYYLPLVFK